MPRTPPIWTHSWLHRFRWVFVLVCCLGIWPEQAVANVTSGPVQSITCPSCPVMEAVIRGSMRLTNAVSLAVAQSLQALVTAVLGIWILLQAGKLLFPFGPLDRVPNMLNSVAGTLLLAIAVLFAIGTPDLYKRYILHPIIAAGINSSNVILEQSLSVGQQVTAGAPRNPGSGSTSSPSLATVSATAGSADFETEVTTALVDHIETVHESLQKGICLGVGGTGMEGCMGAAAGTIVKLGVEIVWNSVKGFFMKMTPIGAIINTFTNKKYDESGDKFMGLIARVIVVFLIIVIYAIVWVKYPLYVLDVVMKWAILSIFWPLMMAALVLPATRPAVFTALKGLGHAALTLVFMSAVIGTSLSIVDQLWNDMGSVTLNLKVVGHPDYWLMVITGLLMLYLMRECPRMAAAFIDSSIDLQVSEGIWRKMKEAVWFVADVATAGKAGRARRILNIK